MAPAGVTEVELWLRRRGDHVLAAIDDDELQVRLDPEEALRIPLELSPRRFARGAGRALDTAHERHDVELFAWLDHKLGPEAT